MVANILWDMWRRWSDVDSPEKLSDDTLRSLARDKAAPELFDVWGDAYKKTLNQFEAQERERRKAALFLLFFRSWENDLAGRWMFKVGEYKKAIKEAPAETLPWEDVRGAGKPVVEPDAKGRLPVIIPGEDKFGVPIGAKPLVLPWEVQRDSSDVITDSNTDGELRAVHDLQRSGYGRIESFWRTEVGACKRCEPLEGQPRSVWSQVAPRGPKLHWNCRCYLEHRRYGG